MPVRAVAFDLDDTLAVTERDRERLLRDAAERADVRVAFDREDYVEAHREHSGSTTREPVFEALVDDIEGGGFDDRGPDSDCVGGNTRGRGDLASEAAGSASTNAAVEPTGTAEATALARAYRDAIGESLAPVAGAETVVADLRRHYPVGLLTDGPENAQRDKLRRLGWTEAFDAVVVTGGIHAPKPDPVAFHAIAAALDVAPAETVYVGDNPDRDIAGAAAAGMLPLQVVYHGGPDPHPAAVATLRRTDLPSLPGVLEDLTRD